MPVAIITGGNSGIGKATAVTFAERGHDVGITWHEAEEGAREPVDELAEPDARYCTGHSLVVDGGMLLMGAVANQLLQD